MTTQAKELKALLKRHNITNSFGKLKVRTDRHRYAKGYVEYGDAVAIVRELTQKEIEDLAKEDKYLSIHVYRHPRIGFSIIKSSGSNISVKRLDRE